MPLYKKINTDNFLIGIWRITEDISFFTDQIKLYPQIEHEGKKLQWYATRYLVNQLLNQDVEIENNELGKPFLLNNTTHLSLSHTPAFAAAILSTIKLVGIDLEMINPKIERIQHKFLTQHEIASIQDKEKLQKLILYWSAKETLYKLHGQGGIDFKTQLLIQPFDLQLAGTLQADILATDIQFKNLPLQYEFFEDHVLTYVCAPIL